MTNLTQKQKTRKTWQESENKILTAMVLSLVGQGKTYLESFKEASLVLGRTPAACETQWRKKLKKNNKSVKINLDTVHKGLLGDYITPISGDNTDSLHYSNIDFETLAKTLNEQLRDSPKTIKSILENLQTPPKFELDSSSIANATQIANDVKPKKTTQSRIQMLLKSAETLKDENLKILNSGKGGTDYMVINNEEDFGYLVTSDGERITGCNCPHHVHRGAVCKHILKVALDKNLEVF